MAIKGFHIGQMRQTVTFRENNPTDATTGGGVDAYTDLVTTRARLKKLSGGRVLSFGDILNSEGYELICRVQDVLENNLRIDCKVVYLNHTFTISSWEKFELKGWFYIMDLKIMREDHLVP